MSAARQASLPRAWMAMGLLMLGALLLAQPAPAAGRIIIATQLEPPTLDPTLSAAVAITEILDGNVYEGLVQFGADGVVLPKLATSWEISPDGLTYTFHLVANARFQDGTLFDSSVAKFTLDRIFGPQSVHPQKARYAAIRSVEAIDPLTLRVSLSRRSGGLLQYLAFGSAVMFSPQSVKDNAVHPVGTGPYRFLRWRRGDSVTLERNPDYRGEPVSLDQVTFKFISDPTAAYAALLAGDIDAFANYPAPESFAQFAADPRFKVFKGTTEMEVVLSMNERVAPFDNVLVRRAISHGLDRRAIIDGAMFGYGTPIGSHFPPGNPAYVDLTGEYPHDIAKAKALLAQAGYPQGFSMTLKLPPPSYARRGGEIVAAQLAQIGIHLRIENLEWAQWLDQVYTRHDYDMSMVGHAEPLDYDIYARENYYFGYSNPDFNALIAELDDSVDPQRRLSLLHQIQHKLADDAVNGFLFQYPRLDIWSAHITGISFNNTLGVIDLSRTQTDRPVASVAGSAGARSAFGTLGLIFGVGAAGMLVLIGRRFGSLYLARRVGVLALTMLAASAVIFVAVQVVPGDPVRYMMGMESDPGNVAALRHLLGLDATPWHRYVAWITGMLHGDFGISYTYRVPVGPLVAERLQVSLPLALYALLLSMLVSFPLGLIAAARAGQRTDALLSGVTQFGLAIPNFWLGMLLVLLFALQLHWASAGGFPGWDAGFWTAVKALTLPAIALATPQAAILSRVLRGALIETLREDYIRSARAKGASERRVLLRHALPNAMVPVLTIVGMQFSFLLAGGVIIENVFFLPGLGRLVFQAIVQRDLIVVQSVVVLLVMAVVTISFLVELSYVLLNPRLGLEPRT
jgi:peptide/nickel transport system substrate-binding protein